MHDRREELGHISMAGSIEDKRYAFEDGPRVLGQYAAVYITEGEGFFEDETRRRQPVATGSLILLVPGKPHRYGPTLPGDWSEVYLVFEGLLFDCWRDSGVHERADVIGPLLPVEHWRAAFESVVDVVERTSRSDPLVAACKLQLLLAEAVSDESKTDGEARFRDQVADIVERRLRYDLDLRDLAAKVGMGYESFRKRFRAAFGQSPHRYLAAQVVRRASILLRDSSNLDKEIAAELGFSDEHYFSRRFRQLAGMSPTEYRRTYGKEP